MGTEDSQLLVEEYEMQKEHLAGKTETDSAPAEYKAHLEHMLKSRDSFIAARIADTLQEGEVGLLFLGALHRLDALKGSDIRVETLAEGPHKAVRRPRS